MSDLERLIQDALLAGERLDVQFEAAGKTWVLSLAPVT